MVIQRKMFPGIFCDYCAHYMDDPHSTVVVEAIAAKTSQIDSSQFAQNKSDFYPDHNTDSETNIKVDNPLTELKKAPKDVSIYIKKLAISLTDEYLTDKGIALVNSNGKHTDKYKKYFLYAKKSLTNLFVNEYDMFRSDFKTYIRSYYQYSSVDDLYFVMRSYVNSKFNTASDLFKNR